MFMDTAWLAHHIPMFYVPPVQAYRAAALRKIPPVFENLEQEAEAATDAEFERLCAQPAGPDHDGDLGDLAERATDYGNEYGETMFAIRQSVLNVLAVGLQHLFEQQQKSLFYQTCEARTGTEYSWKALNYSLLGSKVVPTALPGAAKLKELRLAANTIKHGSGKSALGLAALRPDLFVFELSTAEGASVDEQRRAAAMQASHLAFAPLGGGELYVTETDLADWSDAVLRFWRGLAASLWAQHFPNSEFPYGS